MNTDSTGLREVKRGAVVMCGPFMWNVKGVRNGQATLVDGQSKIVRACNHVTVYDHLLQPADHDHQPRMEDHD